MQQEQNTKAPLQTPTSPQALESRLKKSEKKRERKKGAGGAEFRPWVMVGLCNFFWLLLHDGLIL
jgi:hypothetical protein